MASLPPAPSICTAPVPIRPVHCYELHWLARIQQEESEGQACCANLGRFAKDIVDGLGAEDHAGIGEVIGGGGTQQNAPSVTKVGAGFEETQRSSPMLFHCVAHGRFCL
jgi:hypothetical protein